MAEQDSDNLRKIGLHFSNDKLTEKGSRVMGKDRVNPTPPNPTPRPPANSDAKVPTETPPAKKSDS
jgi:hypothetical protein